jgi:hypothetical protein
MTEHNQTHGDDEMRAGGSDDTEGHVMRDDDRQIWEVDGHFVRPLAAV